MTAQIALLRAINLAGKARIAMSDLRDTVAGRGHGRVRTVLQSGNVVFDGKGAGGRELECALERAVARTLGLATDIMVRSGDEWERLIAANPYPAEAERAPGRLVMMALKEAPGDDAVEALRAAIRGREVATALGRELYVVYPDGIGRSKLTTALIERHLGTRATGRNWNTVLRIAAAVRAS